MKRTIGILVILLAMVSVASANGVWKGIADDPNALLPWEDGSNWYDGVVASSTDGTVIIEAQTAWFDNVTTFPGIAYLTTETTLGGMVVGMSADRPGKLHVGPTGVMTVTTANCGMTWNGTDRYGTLINEGTINALSNMALNRKGEGIMKLLGDSVLNIGGRAEMIQYSGTLDLHMEGNAIVNGTGDSFRNASVDAADGLTWNMYGNTQFTQTSPNTYFYSFGNSSLNDNAVVTWNCRFNNNGGAGGTLDINDSAVMDFAGSHGMLHGETVNINGGTLKASNANLYGIQDAVAINISAGALVCETVAAKNLYNSAINLSGTGIINGWGQIYSGSLSMTGGKLGCTTAAALGNINNNGGAMSPNIDEVGNMTINADLTQSSSSSIEIDLAGAAGGEADILTVSGTLYLNGTLDIRLIDGFESTIADGDSFVVVQAGDIDGAFTNTDATSYITVNQGGTDYEFFVAVLPTQVVLTYSADGNVAPIVDAGFDFSVEDGCEAQPATTTITGSYIDDGRPAPATYTYTWSLVSAPLEASINIHSPNSLQTDVTIEKHGIYVFKLQVSDGQKIGQDNLSILKSMAPGCGSVGGPLMAHYEFEGDYTDSTVNSLDLIAVGPSASISTDAALGDGSLYLGGGTYLTRPNISLGLEIGNEATLSYWIKENPANPSDGWGCIFANGRDMDNNGDGMNDYGICLLRPDAGRFKWQPGQFAHQYNNGADNDGDTVADPSVSDGTWHMVTCMYDKVAGASQIYIDGVLKSTAIGFVGGLDAPYDPAIIIGTNGQGATPADWKYFRGHIDDLRVYNVLVDIPFPPPPPACPMDLNDDGSVALDDITEIVLVIKDAPGYSVPATTAPEGMDLNGDGSVALDDITEIVLVIKDAPGYSVECSSYFP